MTGIARRGLTAALAVLLLALAGCGGGTAPPADSFYRLEADDPGRRYGRPLLPGTVEVARFSADGVTGERPIVYSTGAGTKVRRYSYHYWVDSPTRLVQESLVDALRRVDAAEVVATPDLRLRADWRVEGRIDRLEHRLLDDGRARVLVALEVSVVDARDGDLVMIETFRAERTVNTQRVEAAIPAFNVALTDVIAYILDRVAERTRDDASG